MSEQYRFMRYYLPGSLFLIYMMVLIVPNLPANTIRFLFQEVIIGIFATAFVASPVVGYIMYGFYNYLYEHLAKKSEYRHALNYLENLDFIKDDKKRAHFQEQLRCFIQKKEFLDLIYHSTLKRDGKIEIGPEILVALKNHLSNFAARVVCGLFAPLLCIPGCLIVWITLSLFGLEFAWNGAFLLLSSTLIIAISGILLCDCTRVLFEAYQLEAYFIKAKREEIEELLKRLFTKQT